MLRVSLFSVTAGVVLLVSSVLAQAPSGQQPKAPVPSKEPAKNAATPQRSPAWQAVDAARKLDVDTLIRYVNEHPGEFKESMIAYNTGFALENFIKENRADPSKVKDKLQALAAAFNKVEPYGRTNFQWGLARTLSKQDVALDLAADVARRSVEQISKDEYISADIAQDESYRKRRAEAAKPGSRSEDDAERPDSGDYLRRYQAEMSTRLTVLGDVELKLDHRQVAEDALKRAIEFSPNSRALLSLSKIAADRGDSSEALRWFTAAYLRGQLKAAQIEEYRQLYFKLHQGASEQQLTQYLDEEYAKTFRNPAKFTPYRADPGKMKQVALAEIFSGAGCEPCVSVDLALDAMLQRYSRSEFAALVYHANAPSADPLSNKTGQLREGYYKTGGSAPQVFLQGVRAQCGDGAAPHTQQVLDKLIASVDKLLERPPAATLNIKAVRTGSQVRVQVTGHAPSVTPSARLQIMLVETQATFSGQNGLRFHPMVVRASAGRTDTATGLPVIQAKLDADYTFDLDQIAADNLKWYDEFIEGLKKRLPAGFELDGFPEKKHAVNPANLAVVAFLQDDKSKNVLQAAYAVVASDSTVKGN